LVIVLLIGGAFASLYPYQITAIPYSDYTKKQSYSHTDLSGFTGYCNRRQEKQLDFKGFAKIRIVSQKNLMLRDMH
jgi:hypothetical protein